MIVALHSSSYLVGCLRIMFSSSLSFFMDIIWHNDSIGEDFQKILISFEFFMNFQRFGQTTVDQSLWLVHELVESYKWCSAVTLLWCSISPRCPFLVCKRHFGRCFTNGSLNLSFLWHFWNFQINFEVHGANTIGHVVVVHTCAKFGLIWAMLGETIVPKHHKGVNEHDRCTSFLIRLSGLP